MKHLRLWFAFGGRLLSPPYEEGGKYPCDPILPNPEDEKCVGFLPGAKPGLRDNPSSYNGL